MRKLLTVFSLLITMVQVQGQDEDAAFIRRLANEVFTHSMAYENLRALTKQVGGRLAGSPQMVKAELWGVQALKAAQADSVWMQQCLVPHWIRGGKDEAFVSSGAYKNKSLSVAALGNSVGSMKALQAPVLEVASFDDLEKKKDLVKGKIVFYNYPFNPTFVHTFESYGDAVVYRSQGLSRAAKYGALAVIVRSMSHSTDNYAHTGSTRYADDQPKIPAIAIGLQDADWLSTRLKEAPLSVSLKTSGRFLPDTIGHNVIGEIKGTEKPGEFITVGGHLDSWDLAEGAHDDGAGIVQTIEVLRVLKALNYKPKRTIRFVLFANEENGLRGGTKYAEEAKRKGEKHIFALESDAGGFTPRGFNLVASDQQINKVRSWKDLLQPYGTCEFSNGAGADITPLNQTQGTPVAELSPDSQRYFDMHHAANDVFENVNKRELELGAINMAALIYLVDKYGLE